MAQIIYKINTGTPDFTAHLEPSVSPDQVQNALGTYSFTDIAADTYSITIIDSNGCIGFKDNIIAVDDTTTTTTTYVPVETTTTTTYVPVETTTTTTYVPVETTTTTTDVPVETTTTTTNVTVETTTTTTAIVACFSGSTIFDTAYGGKILNIYSANTAALIVLPFADWGEGFSGGTWDYAMSAVTALSAGGFNDWRLPTIAEWNIIGFTTGVSTALGWYDFLAYWTSDVIDDTNAYTWWTSDDTASTYGGTYNISQSNLRLNNLYGLAVRNAYC